MYFRPQRVWYRKDWKCASVRGCPERIYEYDESSAVGIASMINYNRVQIGLHELFLNHNQRLPIDGGMLHT
jgi:hypothetical protein